MADDGRAAIEALQTVIKSVRALARVPAKAATEASRSIRTLVAEQIDAQTDPYGTPWAPHSEATKKRWPSHPILVLTGNMLGNLEVKPMAGSGISVTMGGADYAAFHQIGTTNMPARPVLPGVRGLPPSWSQAISQAFDKTSKETMG